MPHIVGIAAQAGPRIGRSRRPAAWGSIAIMECPSGETKHIEAQQSLGIGSVRLVSASWRAPIDRCGTAENHHLELALLPGGEAARACFPDLWGPRRFAPMGSLFLLPARHRVHARSECREQRSVICNLRPDAVAAWLGQTLPWTPHRLERSLDIVNPGVRAMLLRIAEELRSPGFASEAMLQSMALQLAIEMSRHLQGGGDTARLVHGGLGGRRLRLIDERLQQSGAPPTLDELAALCGVSVRHLTRGFRASRGCSIGAYIAEQRMARARRLLAAGLSVKAVAYDSGFSAPSNFAAAFLRATGETPRQYRARNRIVSTGIH
jgi:AraC family transcriptional regulator